MPLILPGNVASATAATGYDVDNSCRFESAQLLRTNTSASATNVDRYTVSVWVKRSKLGANQNIIADVDGSAPYYQIYFKSDDTLRWQDSVDGNSDGDYITNRVFRDVSAWYHIVCRYDSTLGTAGDRMRMYINGVEETSFSTSDNVDQNDNGHFGEASSQKCIADNGADGREYFGYMSEFIGVDGQSLAPTEFGEFDEDSPTIWKPIDVSGITQGTHGFYLKFEDSSDLGVATLGANWTAAGLAAADQATDTPTNNFATINPLDNFYANATLSEGNLKMVSGSSRECSSTATIALSNGKWFWEYEVTTFSAPFGGIQPIPSFGNTASAAVLQTNGLGYLKTGKVETTDGSGGSTELASDYATYAVNDIIGVALDLDAGTNIIYFYKNGALQGSGVNLTHVDSTANGHYLIAFGAVSGQDTFEINFGNPITALDSANADANGYGAFEFAVPSGFFSICTKNLAEYG